MGIHKFGINSFLMLEKICALFEFLDDLKF